MRNTTARMLSVLLGLLAVAGAATAIAPSHHPCDLPAVPEAPTLPELPQSPDVPTLPAAPDLPVSAGCDAATDAETGEHAANANADAADASAAAGGVAGHSTVDETAEGGFFVWISIAWSAFFGDLCDLLGLAESAPATDGGLDLDVSADGAAIDATVGDVNLNASAPVPETPETPALPEPAGAQVDAAKGKADEAKGKATEAQEKVKGLLPSL